MQLSPRYSPRGDDRDLVQGRTSPPVGQQYPQQHSVQQQVAHQQPRHQRQTSYELFSHNRPPSCNPPMNRPDPTLAVASVRDPRPDPPHSRPQHLQTIPPPRQQQDPSFINTVSSVGSVATVPGGSGSASPTNADPASPTFSEAESSLHPVPRHRQRGISAHGRGGVGFRVPPTAGGSGAGGGGGGGGTDSQSASHGSGGGLARRRQRSNSRKERRLKKRKRSQEVAIAVALLHMLIGGFGLQPYSSGVLHIGMMCVIFVCGLAWIPLQRYLPQKFEPFYYGVLFMELGLITLLSPMYVPYTHSREELTYTLGAPRVAGSLYQNKEEYLDAISYRISIIVFVFVFAVQSHVITTVAPSLILTGLMLIYAGDLSWIAIAMSASWSVMSLVDYVLLWLLTDFDCFSNPSRMQQFGEDAAVVSASNASSSTANTLNTTTTTSTSAASGAAGNHHHHQHSPANTSFSTNSAARQIAEAFTPTHTVVAGGGVDQNGSPRVNSLGELGDGNSSDATGVSASSPPIPGGRVQPVNRDARHSGGVSSYSRNKARRRTLTPILGGLSQFSPRYAGGGGASNRPSDDEAAGINRHNLVDCGNDVEEQENGEGGAAVVTFVAPDDDHHRHGRQDADGGDGFLFNTPLDGEVDAEDTYRWMEESRGAMLLAFSPLQLRACVLDMHCVAIDFNVHFAVYSGVDPAQVIGRSLVSVLEWLRVDGLVDILSVFRSVMTSKPSQVPKRLLLRANGPKLTTVNASPKHSLLGGDLQQVENIDAVRNEGRFALVLDVFRIPGAPPPRRRRPGGGGGGRRSGGPGDHSQSTAAEYESSTETELYSDEEGEEEDDEEDYEPGSNDRVLLQQPLSHAVCEALPFPLCMLNADGTIVFWSDTLAHLVERTPFEMLGKNAFDEFLGSAQDDKPLLKPSSFPFYGDFKVTTRKGPKTLSFSLHLWHEADGSRPEDCLDDCKATIVCHVERGRRGASASDRGNPVNSHLLNSLHKLILDLGAPPTSSGGSAGANTAASRQQRVNMFCDSVINLVVQMVSLEKHIMGGGPGGAGPNTGATPKSGTGGGASILRSLSASGGGRMNTSRGTAARRSVSGAESASFGDHTPREKLPATPLAPIDTETSTDTNNNNTSATAGAGAAVGGADTAGDGEAPQDTPLSVSFLPMTPTISKNNKNNNNPNTGAGGDSPRTSPRGFPIVSPPTPRGTPEKVLPSNTAPTLFKVLPTPPPHSSMSPPPAAATPIATSPPVVQPQPPQSVDPLDSGWAKLVSQDLAICESKPIIATQREFKVGRSAQCALVVKDTFISGVQFRICRKPGGKSPKAVLTDTSVNGTFVNIKKVGKGKNYVLKDGDLITFQLSNGHIFLGFRFEFTTRRKRVDPSAGGAVGSGGLVPNLQLGSGAAGGANGAAGGNRDSDEIASEMDWKIGEEMLGKGGNAEVFLGINLTNGKLIAVKRVRIPQDTQPRTLRQYKALQEEIQLISKAQHKNIVRYYGSKQTSSHLNILLEFVPGGSIRHLLDNFGALNTAVVLRYLGQILEGMDYLHSSSIVHADMKCANVLVTDKGHVKITDFGTSKILRETQQAAGEGGGEKVAGTLLWMAPEVIRGKSQPSFASDVWGIGCCLLEMMSGEHPWFEYEFESEEQIINLLKLTDEPPEIPPCSNQLLNTVAHRCLALEPKERPTIKELLGLLGHSPSPPPPPVAASATKPTDSNAASVSVDVGESLLSPPMAQQGSAGGYGGGGRQDSTSSAQLASTSAAGIGGMMAASVTSWEAVLQDAARARESLMGVE